MSVDTNSATFSQLWRIEYRTPGGLVYFLELKMPSEAEAHAEGQRLRPDWEIRSVTRMPTPLR